MRRLLRAFVDGMILRCPRCHVGWMFAGWFRIHPACQHCGMPFESASGEITGGMGINIATTLVIVIVAAGVLGFQPDLPIEAVLLGLGAFAIGFPIVFYHSSRGLWIALLFLTANSSERD